MEAEERIRERVKEEGRLATKEKKKKRKVEAVQRIREEGRKKG